MYKHNNYMHLIVIICKISNIVFITIIIFQFISRFSAYSLWDDAYIFIRYADLFIATGTLSFNPGGQPTYGLTSLGYLLVVLPIRLLFPQNPSIVMLMSSSICGIIFMVLVFFFIRKETPNSFVSLISISLVLFSFAQSSSDFITHFTSGMDTTFVLVYVTFYLFISKWYEKSYSKVNLLIYSIVSGLAFIVRSDLLIITTIVPITSLIFSKSPLFRKKLIILLGVTLLIVFIQIVICLIYFKSPLPLPFYAKTQGIYGDFIQENYSKIPISELIDFIQSYSLFVSIIGLNILLNFRKWWLRLSDVDKGFFLGIIFFVVFYLLFVLQIMHKSQRFYYPILPPLILLVIISLMEIIEYFRVIPLLDLIKNKPYLNIFSIIIFFVILFNTGPIFVSNIRNIFSINNKIEDKYIFNIYREYKSNPKWKNYWFCLDRFSKLPDDLVMATTEIGHPLAMNPHKTIIDMSGLNETTIAHRGFNSEIFFQKYQPDLIYMPNPDYREMILDIMSNSNFIQLYELFPSTSINARMGIALRKDSPYYYSMKRIVNSTCR